jgi:hypothetical protein
MVNMAAVVSRLFTVTIPDDLRLPANILRNIVGVAGRSVVGEVSVRSFSDKLVLCSFPYSCHDKIHR